ncbi:MAG: hypothetical protein GPJ52_02805 [Candidatus Heimdallarchaeota archaeon]|nr:hypothetical protein [Candidatus Heimdallarchaeota archaeon]
MVSKEDFNKIPEMYREKIREIVNRMPNRERKKELLHKIVESYWKNFEVIYNDDQFTDDSQRHKFIIALIYRRYGNIKPQFQEGDFATAKEWYLHLLKQEKCVLCDSNSNLHYHHVNPATKEYNVIDMINKNLSKDLIEKEMKKCIVVCSQCHLNKIHRKNYRLKKFGEDIKKLLSKYSNLTVDTK